MLVFDAAEIKAFPVEDAGVTLMDLDDGETLLTALPIGSGAVLQRNPRLGRQTGRGSAGRSAARRHSMAIARARASSSTRN